jgi:alpha-beta hydrolase superfamily lysophospholipase
VDDAPDNRARPDTVVLIHGLWLTARSWEHWVARLQGRGLTVIAESWPGLGDDVAAVRDDPSALAGLGLAEVVDRYDGIVRGLAAPPIIIGHSFGGLVTQILLDRGLGAAGVAIASAPPKGIWLLPLSTLRTALPALKNPANRNRAVPLTHGQFRYRFTNTLSIDDSVAAYERYDVPGSGRMLFEAALANVTPHAITTVDFRDENRAPLLFVAGGKDHISPPSLVRANCGKYRAATPVTEYKEYPRRSHWLAGEPGWESVADEAVDWALRHA